MVQNQLLAVRVVPESQLSQGLAPGCTQDLDSHLRCTRARSISVEYVPRDHLFNDEGLLSGLWRRLGRARRERLSHIEYRRPLPRFAGSG